MQTLNDDLSLDPSLRNTLSELGGISQRHPARLAGAWQTMIFTLLAGGSGLALLGVGAFITPGGDSEDAWKARLFVLAIGTLFLAIGSYLAYRVWCFARREIFFCPLGLVESSVSGTEVLRWEDITWIEQRLLHDSIHFLGPLGHLFRWTCTVYIAHADEDRRIAMADSDFVDAHELFNMLQLTAIIVGIRVECHDWR